MEGVGKGRKIKIAIIFQVSVFLKLTALFTTQKKISNFAYAKIYIPLHMLYVWQLMNSSQIQTVKLSFRLAELRSIHIIRHDTTK
jgi:hypothetical protein